MKEFAAKVLGIKEEIPIPDNCEVWDDKGNVINSSKIIIREKKKEYPKTVDRCRAIVGAMSGYGAFGYQAELMSSFMSLLICRDAYWKIAGEEMGLGKPWTPQDTNTFSIFYDRLTSEIEKQDGYCGANSTLEFPTEEMRDAFYENFKELIEECKELL